jgi:hypothetical protein
MILQFLRPTRGRRDGNAAKIIAGLADVVFATAIDTLIAALELPEPGLEARSRLRVVDGPEPPAPASA